jgi:hypothetical protein
MVDEMRNGKGEGRRKKAGVLEKEGLDRYREGEREGRNGMMGCSKVDRKIA